MAQTAVEVRTGRRRGEVVAAAARLFSERGYHGTSIQHLADALGLRKGSIYAHIGSKEDLLYDVVNDGAARPVSPDCNGVRNQAERVQAAGGIFIARHVGTDRFHVHAAIPAAIPAA